MSWADSAGEDQPNAAPRVGPCKRRREGNPMQLGTTCIALAILAGSPAIAQGGRYELVPEPDVKQTSSNRVTSTYVVDKKANQFWICTARYNFQDLTANNGDCVQLPSDIGRPSLSEAYDVRPVTGTTVSAPIFRYSGSSNPQVVTSSSALYATPGYA